MKLKVTGMTCGHCEMAVTKALQSLEGVTTVVEVSREKQQVEIEGTAPVDTVIRAITEEGYQAEVLS